MPKPPGGLLRRKTRLQNKWIAWTFAKMRKPGAKVIGICRLDLRNQRHRKECENQ